MNSKKWSILLLIAMSFSLVHDYAFLLHDDQHSVKEYVSQLETPASSMSSDLHDTHFEYHVAYIFPTKSASLSNMKREKTIFTYNEIFLSWNYFNFFKPPIA